MPDHDAHEAPTDGPVGEQQHQHAATGGERYQTAHREHAVEREGPATSRSARGTGPARDQRHVSPNEASPDTSAASTEPGRPHPDDEAWLKDLGYPKLGKHLQSRTTQIEHGPNAGGTQQGDESSR